jgi:hypothetical protein
MLLIRKEQFDALRRSALQPVREKFISLLRTKLPRHTAPLSDDSLHALCDKGVVKASGYGLHTEYNVYVFTAAMLVIGENFDRNPATAWSQEILRDRMMEEDIKAKLIELRVFMDSGTDIAPHGR